MFPIQFKVVMEQSEVVTRLRSALAEKDRELSELRTRLNRAEFELGCETHVSGELLDLLRHHGIRTRFDKRR